MNKLKMNVLEETKKPVGRPAFRYKKECLKLMRRLYTFIELIGYIPYICGSCFAIQLL